MWEGAAPEGPSAQAQAWGWRSAAPEERPPLVALWLILRWIIKNIVSEIYLIDRFISSQAQSNL